MDIKLRLPLKMIKVTQPFGENFVEFYHQFGLNGHNGIDFAAKTLCNCYAAHDGTITVAGTDQNGGVCVQIKGNGYYTVYYHLDMVFVSIGSQVKAGDLIARCDNTGIYTTGDHLHFGMKFIDANGTLNKDNGYGGAIDPAPYFVSKWDGELIKNKDWDKCRAYHRYDRGRPKGGLENEKRVIVELQKYLKYTPSCEQINACVYGGWDRGTITNEGMFDIWGQMKKDEYLSGMKPFLDRS